jgi:phage I-like protein
MAGQIKAVVGRPKGKDTTEVQTLIFPKDGWTPESVKSWLKSHDNKTDLDTTEDSYRARQRDHGDFEEGSFRTIDFGKAKSTERHIATCLSNLLPAASTSFNGRATVQIPIAVTGSWHKNGHSFSITDADMASMVANFGKRQNNQVVIDYEHASEDPAVALGQAVPAGGWVHALFMDRSGVKPKLIASVEWTPKAAQMIRAGEYRFFSPAIDWSATDKLTGEPQGATLTSGALTNHPFLEELPPIELLTAGASRSRAAVLLSDLAADSTNQGGIIMALDEMPKLTGRKLAAAEPHAGHICLLAGDTPVGYITKSQLADIAKKHLPDNDDDDTETMSEAEKLEELGRRELRLKDTQELAQLRAEVTRLKALSEKLTSEASNTESVMEELGVPNISLSEVKTMIETGRETAKDAGKRRLLSEAVDDKGRFDKSKAAAAIAASQGAIVLSDYTALDIANDMLEGAVQAGKILPRDRKFFLRDAVDRPEEFKAFVKAAVPVVQLGVRGAGESQTVDVDEEVQIETKRLLSENKGLNRTQAVEQLFRENPDLRRRYDAAHRMTLGGRPAQPREM